MNCVPFKLIKKLNVELNNLDIDFPIFDYNNNKIEIFGTVELNCIDLNFGTGRVAEFVVVGDKAEPILGLEACVSFGLIERLDKVGQSDMSGVACLGSERVFLDRFKDVFCGLGRFPGTFSIGLKEGSRPVLHYNKRIPNSLMDRFRVLLGHMTEEGIISPVD